MPRYQYSPLSDRRENIRLIRLLPAETEEAEIRVELLEYSLAASRRSRHSYEALSYVWGDVHPPQSIFIGDDHLVVTPNLYAALVQLRDAHFPRIIWIDAVCINQADTDEKEDQIQSMAKIYGMAKRVIVWLGQAADGSDEALEAIRTAGIELAQPFDKRAVDCLLQRTWFKRIWILQEVAAARHIVITCGATEIEGFAFCVGLERLQIIDPLSSQFSSVRAVISLIRPAIFRPKFEISRSGIAALNICSLCELISMYNTLNSTQRHDKVYALLGMATDDVSSAGLLPDYHVPWEELLQRLLRYLVRGGEMILRTWADKEKVEIYGRGCALASVSRATREPDGSQTVLVKFNNMIEDHDYYERNCWRWTLQVTANDVRDGDIIYLLKGASKPMIIRPLRAVFYVIVIAATSPIQIRSKNFSRRLPLVWDWAEFTYNTRTESPDVQATSCWTAALVLHDAAQYSRAKNRIMRFMEMICTAEVEDATVASPGGEHRLRIPSQLWNITEAEAAEIVPRFGEEIATDLLLRTPHSLGITEDILLAIIQYRGVALLAQVLEEMKDKVRVTPVVIEAAARYLKIRFAKKIFVTVLDIWEEDGNTITERILVAAAGNVDCSIEVMKLLLDRKGETDITEAILLAAASTEHHEQSDGILIALIRCGGSRIKITEAILLAAMTARWGGKTEILLDYKRDETEITEAILVAAAAGFARENTMKILLDRKGDKLEITEAILLAAAGSARDKMEILLYYNGDKTEITEALLVAAAGNIHGNTTPISSLLGDVSTKKRRSTMVAHITASRNMQRLFERKNKQRLSDCRSDEIPVTEAVFIAAAANTNDGDRFMDILLNHQKKNNVKVTEAILLAVVRNEACGLWILKSLASREGKGVEFSAGVVTQKVLEAAVASGVYASEFVSRLMWRVDCEIIWEPVVAAAVANEGDDYRRRELLSRLYHRNEEAFQIFLSMGGGEQALYHYDND